MRNLGVLYRNRTDTTGATNQRADHYTKNTIGTTALRDRHFTRVVLQNLQSIATEVQRKTTDFLYILMKGNLHGICLDIFSLHTGWSAH